MEEVFPTTCFLCSLGCGLSIGIEGQRVLDLEYDSSFSVNEGALCARGNYLVEILNHPQRLLSPLIYKNGQFQEVNLPEALKFSANQIRNIKRKAGGDAIGVITSGNCTREEVFLARELATRVLQTPYFDSLAEEEDYQLLSAGEIFGAERMTTIEKLSGAEVILALGDVFTKSPVLARHLLNFRYAKRENLFLAVDSKRSSTTWFANLHLQNRPGAEALVLAGMIHYLLTATKSPWKKKVASFWEKLPLLEDMARISDLNSNVITQTAQRFLNASRAVIMLAPNFGRMADINLVAQLAGIICLLSGKDKKLLFVLTTGNARGVFSGQVRKGGMRTPEMIEAATAGKIKGLLILGADISSLYPAHRIEKLKEKLSFFLTAGPFTYPAMGKLGVQFPSAVWQEKLGSIISLDGRQEQIRPVIPPPGEARPETEIIASLAANLGEKNFLSRLKKMSKKPIPLEKKISDEGIFRQLEMDSLRERLLDLYTRLSKVEGNYPFMLLGDITFDHAGDGGITRQISWVKAAAGMPWLEIHPEDGKKLKLIAESRVRIKSRGGEITTGIKLTENVPPGIVSLPVHFPEVRNLFSGRTITERHSWEVEPEPVSLFPVA